MINNRKNLLRIILLIFVLLAFLRIDYRFKTTVECCSDEYDYFMHASTIALDFDLDYSNQKPGEFAYYKNNKTTPIGFIGTGILAAPFLLIGNSLSNLFNEDIKSEILNYKLFFYSLSSVFYYFFSYWLIFKSLNLLNIKTNKYFLLLIFSGSGMTYYAFERFGMTHVFEIFTMSALIFTSIKYFLESTESKKLYGILIPIIITTGFLTRMSNFYIFLIPLIIKYLIIDRKIPIRNKILTDKFFIASGVISFVSYFLISNSLDGDLVFNPQTVYGTEIKMNDYVNGVSSSLETLFSLLKTFFIVLTSFEFGIFWVSPILFIGLLSSILKLKNLNNLNTYLLLFCFAQNFAIIHIWQALGSSYGFRYLLSLTPLCILLYYVYFDKNKLIKVYLLIFSIFSNLSILFFETTELTQLSTADQVNSFGKTIRYIEPDYVLGLVKSFFELNSYLIIFTTSFLGAIFFKLLIILFNKDTLIENLAGFKLPVDNPDFQNYLINLENISFDKFVITFLIFGITSFLIVNKLHNVKI